MDDAGFSVTCEEDGLFRVRGEKPERWVRQTDFNNDEAVGYLPTGSTASVSRTS